jgi:cytochrome c553
MMILPYMRTTLSIIAERRAQTMIRSPPVCPNSLNRCIKGCVLPILEESQAAVSGDFRMRWAPLVAWGAVVFAVVGLFEYVTRIELKAIQPPGHAEEWLRPSFTHWAIQRRTARENIPTPPPEFETSMSISAGRALYTADCASCHGSNENGPTAVGRGMWPSAVQLDSPTAQSFSDRELFSIVREGIRFTGMPGFAAVETDAQIWNIVDYIRTLR